MEEQPTLDRRVERSKAKVLAETYRQLVQSGISGVSIDEVSRGSGVSKATIYRHWPSRSALLIDACSRLGTVPDAPDTGDFQCDVRTYLAVLADQLQKANWSSVYPSIIDAAERDPAIGAMQVALHRAFMAPVQLLVERARGRGQIERGVATEELVARLIGPLFYRRWFSKEAIDARFIDGVVRGAMAGDSPP